MNFLLLLLPLVIPTVMASMYEELIMDELRRQEAAARACPTTVPERLLHAIKFTQPAKLRPLLAETDPSLIASDELKPQLWEMFLKGYIHWGVVILPAGLSESRTEVFSLLLEAGVVDRSFLPVYHAVAANESHTLSLLLENGFDANERLPESHERRGETPLALALAHGKYAMAKQLLPRIDPLALVAYRQEFDCEREGGGRGRSLLDILKGRRGSIVERHFVREEMESLLLARMSSVI